MNEDFNKKNVYCSYCGTRFTEQVLWPRKCFRCYNDSWSNPLPVVVVMQTAVRWRAKRGRTHAEYGVIIQQRNIEPKKGLWALTGGYIDAGETWQEAAVREVREEMNLEIKQSDLELFGIESSTNKDTMLVCCVQRTPHDYDWEGGDDPGLKEYFEKAKQFPNSEVQAVDVMWEPQELAFPTHNAWANKYLEELKKL